MKPLLILIICLLSIPLYSQNDKREPALVILAPNKAKMAKAIQMEVDWIDSSYSAGYLNESELKVQMNAYPDADDNHKFMRDKWLRFSQQNSFRNSVSYAAYVALYNLVYLRNTESLIYLSPQKLKGKRKKLASMAEQENVQFTLNFPKVEFSEIDGKESSKLRVQLYDHLAGKIVLDKEFEGKNTITDPGAVLPCNVESLNCTIVNAINPAMKEIADYVTKNTPTAKKERELIEKRTMVLDSLFQNTPPAFITDVIKSNNRKLTLEGYYQGLINEDSTRFVGFFQQFRPMSDSSKPGEIKNDETPTTTQLRKTQILSSKGSIIIGIKYEGRWFLKRKSEVFSAATSKEEGRRDHFENLKYWNIFNEDSYALNSSFWLGSLFDK